jgi:hypothetical protein
MDSRIFTMILSPATLSPIIFSILVAEGLGEAVLEHTVIFEREVKGRIHRFKFKKRCHTHVDIPLQVFYRAHRRKVQVDIETLIDQMVVKEVHEERKGF